MNNIEPQFPDFKPDWVGNLFLYPALLLTGYLIMSLECGTMNPIGWIDQFKQKKVVESGYNILEYKLFNSDGGLADLNGDGVITDVERVKTLESLGIPSFINYDLKSVPLDKLEVTVKGYKEAKSMVFCGFYPIIGEDYGLLKDALEKLQLNDASLRFEPAASPALGRGFRCGFLGLLHMEIVHERLQREFDLSIVVTVPSVAYEVKTAQEIITITNPAELPDPSGIQEISEPWVRVEIITPANVMGAMMELCQAARGVWKGTDYLDSERALLRYELPLATILTDFYDQLKGRSSGYASMSYEFIGFRAGDLARLDILLNEERVDAFSRMVTREEAPREGRRMVEKLKEIIPKHTFSIPIQAAIGGKVVARETISALRKDVTAKLYGGDVTRKRKLLEKQKKGKKRMQASGRVTIPQKAFLDVLKREE